MKWLYFWIFALTVCIILRIMLDMWIPLVVVGGVPVLGILSAFAFSLFRKKVINIVIIDRSELPECYKSLINEDVKDKKVIH